MIGRKIVAMRQTFGRLIGKKNPGLGRDHHFFPPRSMPDQRLTKNRFTTRISIDISVIEEGITSFDRGLERTDSTLDRSRVDLCPVPPAGDPHATISETGNFDFRRSQLPAFQALTPSPAIVVTLTLAPF